MHPLFLLIPAAACLFVTVFGTLELVGAIGHGIPPRHATLALALLSVTLAATAIATIPPALWLAAWVIGGAP